MGDRLAVRDVQGAYVAANMGTAAVLGHTVEWVARASVGVVLQPLKQIQSMTLALSSPLPISTKCFQNVPIVNSSITMLSSMPLALSAALAPLGTWTLARRRLQLSLRRPQVSSIT